MSSSGFNSSIGKNRIELTSVDSTNRYLSEWSEKEPLEEGTSVFANEQTSGRGQKGTEWKSEAGKNLVFSFILYPEFLLATDQFMLSKIVSISVLKTVKKHLSGIAEIKIKWPNDIYADNRKITGILIENSIQNSRIRKSISGIGLNINQTDFPEMFYATSLRNLAGKEFHLNEISDTFFEFMNHYYSLLKSSQYSRINTEYSENLFLLGKPSPFEWKGERISATITGVDHSGKLQLMDENDRLISADLKEIIFLREP
jgi:BirA family biotin operon repressor/biotin-[acetyl-CoA-carboxylase] ligase